MISGNECGTKRTHDTEKDCRILDTERLIEEAHERKCQMKKEG